MGQSLFGGLSLPSLASLAPLINPLGALLMGANQQTQSTIAPTPQSTMARQLQTAMNTGAGPPTGPSGTLSATIPGANPGATTIQTGQANPQAIMQALMAMGITPQSNYG